MVEIPEKKNKREFLTLNISFDTKNIFSYFLSREIKFWKTKKTVKKKSEFSDFVKKTCYFSPVFFKNNQLFTFFRNWVSNPVYLWWEISKFNGFKGVKIKV